MKKFAYIKRGICIILAASLVCLSSCQNTETTPVQSQSGGEETKAVSINGYADTAKKSETVYVTLDAQGNPTKKLVSDWLHTDKENVYLRDKSDLKDIQNIKGKQQPVTEDNGLTWPVSGTDLYYQGTSDKKLPVDITIRYSLDGKEITPAELAGKSGKVKIDISFTNTSSHAVEIGGKTVTMYTPIMAVGGIILPEEIFSAVNVENGAVIGDGSKQIAAFLCIPGLEKSLDLSSVSIPGLDDLSFPESFTITADAQNFELGNMAFAMTANIPELSNLPQDLNINDMRQKLASLQQMQNSLKQLDPQNLLRSLFNDPSLASKAQSLTEDLSLFNSMDTSFLNKLPQYVNQENIDLFEKLRQDMQDAQIGQLLANPNVSALLQQANGLDIGAVKQLMADVQLLQQIDLQKLTSITSMLGGSEQLAELLKQSGELADAITSHSAEMQQLQNISALGDNALQLLRQINALQQQLEQMGVSLTQNDIVNMIQLLLQQKATEQAATSMQLSVAQLQMLSNGSIEEIVPANGVLNVDQRTAAAFCIQMAASQEGIPEEQQAQLLALLQLLQSTEAIAQPYVTAIQNVIGQVQPPIQSKLQQAYEQAQQQGQELTKQVLEILQQAESLNNVIKQSGIDNIQQSLDFVQNIMPSLNSLTQQLTQNKDSLAQMQQLLSDKETMAYLRQTSQKLIAMKKDLDANADNLQLLAQILNATQEPAMQAFSHMLPVLQQDLTNAKPVLEALAQETSQTETQAALQDMPSTLANLLKINADLQANRKIVNTLSPLVTSGNISLAKDMFNQLDNLQSNTDLQQYLDMLDSANSLKERAQAYYDLATQYRIFTDATDDMETDVKFILKTDEIRPQKQQQQQTVQAEEENGIVGWFKSLFKKDK